MPMPMVGKQLHLLQLVACLSGIRTVFAATAPSKEPTIKHIAVVAGGAAIGFIVFAIIKKVGTYCGKVQKARGFTGKTVEASTDLAPIEIKIDGPPADADVKDSATSAAPAVKLTSPAGSEVDVTPRTTEDSAVLDSEESSGSASKSKKVVSTTSKKSLSVKKDKNLKPSSASPRPGTSPRNKTERNSTSQKVQGANGPSAKKARASQKHKKSSSKDSAVENNASE